MKTYSITIIVHGSGRCHRNETVIADRISTLGNSIAFIKDNDIVALYPADLTIVELQNS